MRRTVRLVAATLAAVAALAACSSGTPAPASPTTSGAPDFPVTVGSVTLTQRPTRIVSLGPTATEMLFAVNAGSSELSSFEVVGDVLVLRDITGSGGVRPISLTVHDDLLYVVNAGSDAAAGNISGLVVARGNSDISAAANVSGTFFAAGAANFNAGGNVSGTVIAGQGISSSGSMERPRKR